MGVRDGEEGTTIPPVETCEADADSLLLREAWLTGYSVGTQNAKRQGKGESL